MQNDTNIFGTAGFWIGLIGSFIFLLLAIIGYFITKYFKDTKEKHDLLFARDREKDKILADHETRITVLEK